MSDKSEKKPIMAESLGNAGEIHQINSNEQQKLTTNHGLPISDNQNSLRMGERGPTLLEDFVLREKIFHFDHERIPERIVHARGSGAHGYFECTEAIPELTKASLFQKKETEYQCLPVSQLLRVVKDLKIHRVMYEVLL